MSKATILLVDDEQKLLDLVSFRLRHLGYHVVTAGCGEDALQAAQAEHPDLIMLDIAMPGMDGISVCSRLKESPLFATTPILMLTARSDGDDVNRAIAAGADDYVIKPYDPATLEAKLRRYIGPRPIGSGKSKGSA